MTAALNVNVIGGSGGTTQNVNVAQVGGTTVTSGAGAVTAGTQRVTLASNDPTVGPKAWTNPALVTTTPVTATLVLAAGTAVNGLTVINESASEPCRIRFDNSDATSVTGISLAAGKGLSWGLGQVPTGKISAFSTNAATINVSYC